MSNRAVSAAITRALFKMNQSTAANARAVAATPRTSTVLIEVKPGPAKAAPRTEGPHCQACGERNFRMLKAYEDRHACGRCVGSSRRWFEACAQAAGLTNQQMRAAVVHFARERADGEALMPWDWTAACDEYLSEKGISLPREKSA